MQIDAPAGLNPEETKCFNEIVKPQLEEIYSYEYNIFDFKNVKIFVSKNRFPDDLESPNTKEIENILIKVPEKHLKFVSDVHFVSYHCKDNNHKEVKGRTLPIIYKIIIYPKAHDRLKVILAHEIGHLIFEKGLSKELKSLFASEMVKNFIQIAFWSEKEKDKFIREEFANCYDNFINNPERLKRFSSIYNFFIKYLI